MRSSRLIALDLIAARKRVQVLQLELIEARMAERDLIVNLAEQGKSPREIAKAVGMSPSAAQGIIWRAGRSISGKTRMRRPRTVDLGAMLDAKLLAALRHRAPQAQAAESAT